MPATSRDTGFAQQLKDAWEGDPNRRPSQNTSNESYPTRRGPLRPDTTPNTPH